MPDLPSNSDVLEKLLETITTVGSEITDVQNGIVRLANGQAELATWAKEIPHIRAGVSRIEAKLDLLLDVKSAIEDHEQRIEKVEAAIG